ncbi:MAG TPA: glycosyltransferase family 2 protein [Pirellulales bacterium]|nr:glycosyltransferase family 2 protein [Pirellulales bacterium]
MFKNLKADRLDPIEMEHPKFGQFAQQAGWVRAAEVESCLAEQRDRGGLLGERLVGCGLLNSDQVTEILGRQAEWVARSWQAELAPLRFPYPACLSLCLPAYNEQDNIVSTLRGARAMLPHFVEEFEIVVVDDGSSDETATRVEQEARRDARVRLVRHERNRGYGAAVSSGLRAAAGDLAMFADSDGQFNFLDVARLLVSLRGADFVIGYRHCRAEGARRRLNAWLWGRAVRVLLGVEVRDLDCAFKLFRREMLDRLELTSAGACINAEIMTQCIWGGLQFCEIPVAHYPRQAGAATGARLRVICRALGELPSLRKYRRPLGPAAAPALPRAA